MLTGSFFKTDKDTKPIAVGAKEFAKATKHITGSVMKFIYNPINVIKNTRQGKIIVLVKEIFTIVDLKE